MNTSEKMEHDGLIVSTPTAEEEIEPTEANRISKVPVSVRATPYVPQSQQEAAEDRKSRSQAETDRFARWILTGCIVLIASSHLAQLIAGWKSIPLFSDGANSTLDAIKYFATMIMGYLFGKNSINSK